MSVHHLSNVVLLYDGYNLSGRLNQVSLEHGADALDVTAFGDGTRKHHPGLLTTSLQMSGFYDADGADEPDDVLFPDIGLAADKVVSVFPELAVAGDIGYSFKTQRASYTPSGEVGEMFRFSALGNSRSRLAKVTVQQNGSVSSSGSSTAQQLGAVGATDRLYAVIHILSQAGTSPTIDVIARSDSTSGMSSPTTRATFTQVGAALTAQYHDPVDGAIADDWWDISWTLGGTSPVYTLVAALGIMPNVGA